MRQINGTNDNSTVWSFPGTARDQTASTHPSFVVVKHIRNPLVPILSIKSSMYNYVTTVLIPFMIRLTLVYMSVELFAGIHVNHAVSAAFLHPPRPSVPAPFYFQLPTNRLRSSLMSDQPSDAETTTTDRFDWLTKWEQGQTNRDRLQNRRIKRLLELGLPTSPNPARSVFGSCGGSRTQLDCLENKRQDQDEEQTRKQMIERYKQIILKQMNLDEIPDHPPMTENMTSWKALPQVLRNRLKAEVDSSNQIMDDPVEEDEENESFILLKQYPLELDNVPSMAFTLKISDDIEPNHVSYAWIHAEHTPVIQPGTEFSLWEFIPSVSVYDPIEDARLPTITDLGFDPTFSNGYLDAMLYATAPPRDRIDFHASKTSEIPDRSFRLVRPRIATDRVHSSLMEMSTKFDVTGKLIAWLKRRKRSRSTVPLLRHLLLICPKCENVQIVDPKKVVLEIGFRHTLRRRRRSLNGTEDGLTNSCPPDGQQFTCCTQPLKVQFKDIGWDRWIIHPKKFEPNFCRGSCQVNGLQTTHYDVLNLLSMKNLTQLKSVPRGSIQSCCYPTRRTTFTLLYFDRNKDVRMHTLHNLIVLGCGCS